MECPYCKTVNLDGARHCANCGKQLIVDSLSNANSVRGLITKRDPRNHPAFTYPPARSINPWQAAVSSDTSNAEALIYLENQRVLASGNSYVTLVVATMLTGNDLGVGRDDLQGAYVAQKDFNDGAKLGGMRVRLLIANSGNVSTHASLVAQQIVKE